LIANFSAISWAELMKRSPDQRPRPEASGKSIIDRSFGEIAKCYEQDPNILRFTGCDARDSDGDILLHKAAVRGNMPDVRDLVRLGSKVNTSGDMGNTALHYAAMNGHLVTVEALLDLDADHTVRNEWKETAADVAEIAGHKRVVLLLKSARQRPGAR
jgi:ankyrin repeat protein